MSNLDFFAIAGETPVLIGEITRPSDWHHHLREGDDWLQTTSLLCFNQFEYALAMPNLSTPVQTYEQVCNYYAAITRFAPGAKPRFAYYLNSGLAVSEIHKSVPSTDTGKKVVLGAKYYPLGATTNSDAGVRSYKEVREQLAALEHVGLALMIHGEEHDAPVLDRETAFYSSGILRQIMEEFPQLRITLEHISTEYVCNLLHDEYRVGKSSHLAATITPHHLTATLDDIFKHGIRPANYCCPILKTREDNLALQELACAGYDNIFLGTDNAPHTDETKRLCGKPGIFNIHSALSDVIDVFFGNSGAKSDESGATLANLEKFMSTNGCYWYNQPVPNKKVKIYNQSGCQLVTSIPKAVFLQSGASVTPFRAGESLKYCMV